MINKTVFMNNIKLSAIRKLVVFLITILTGFSNATAQTVSMAVVNCAVTAPNEIRFDVTVTNTGSTVLRWNAVVIRLKHAQPPNFLASTSDAIVWGYVGNSDFPLSFPPSASPTFTYNALSATTNMQVQTGSAIYNNLSCTAPAIAAGATATIGRFFLRDDTQNFVAGESVGFAWNTTSGVVLYDACATTVTNFNSGTNRTLDAPCTLTIPAACSFPTVNNSPSDQSVCTSGTAGFTGSFTGGIPVPSLIWQVQAGGVGAFTDLTESAPYSGTNTGTLTITTPNISLNTNRYRIRANNTCGDRFTNSALLTVIATPNTGTVSGASPLCISNTTTYSSNGDAGGVWSSTNTAVATVDAAGLVTTKSGGITDIRYTINNGTCTVFSFKTLTVTAFTTLAGTAGGAQVCRNATVMTDGSSFSDGSCNLIAKVVPSGASPVSGNIDACVIVDDIVRTYHNIPYAQRHYDITPSVNAAGATGTITLYYTQAEFDAFNLSRGAYPAMPGGPGDVVGISNLRITQFHGTGTYPGNYSGSSENINPNDANIIWDGNMWAISFDVIGFSGFYLFTDPVLPLPVNLLSFSGRNNGNANLLEWTTSSEQNSSYFDLLRSTDGVNFVKVSSVNAAGNSSVAKNYQFSDQITSINSNLFYYRLKMVDVTGSNKLSAVVKIRINNKGFNIEATPNPFADQLKINIDTDLLENAVISLNDINGKKIRQKEYKLRVGNNALMINDLSKLPSGVYLLTVITDSQRQSVKVIKQ